MLSERISYLRQKAGMSQAQLAEKLNITASAEGMYEQGRRTPNIDTLIKLSTIFDVSLDYLITGSEFTSTSSPVKKPMSYEDCPCFTCYWRQQNGR